MSVSPGRDARTCGPLREARERDRNPSCGTRVSPARPCGGRTRMRRLGSGSPSADGGSCQSPRPGRLSPGGHSGRGNPLQKNPQTIASGPSPSPRRERDLRRKPFGSLADHARPRLSADGRDELREIRDHDVFPAVLEEVDPGLDLRSHATGGKLSRSQVLLRLRDREPVQEPLGGLREIQRDLGHVRRDHEVRPPDRTGQGRGCQILVDYGLDADELAVSTDDRDAAATRGDDEPALAVRDSPADLLRFDDLDGPRGGDYTAPTAALVVHHLPALCFLHDDLVLSAVVWTDWLRRVRERGIIRADEDLGDYAGDTTLDAPGGEFVLQGLREQVADLGLAFRPAHVERHRGDDVA